MHNPHSRRAPPRQTLVLDLKHIRCIECGGSAETPYLRPFFSYRVDDGFNVFCRLCSPVRMLPAEKLNEPVAQPVEPTREVQGAAA